MDYISEVLYDTNGDELSYEEVMALSHSSKAVFDVDAFIEEFDCFELDELEIFFASL